MKRRVCDNPYVRPYTADGAIEAADREIERLRDDNHRMLAAIQEFCRQARFADYPRKRQPHVQALFAIANAPPAKAEKEG